jgi:hypothetical protein
VRACTYLTRSFTRDNCGTSSTLHAASSLEKQPAESSVSVLLLLLLTSTSTALHSPGRRSCLRRRASLALSAPSSSSALTSSSFSVGRARSGMENACQRGGGTRTRSHTERAQIDQFHTPTIVCARDIRLRGCFRVQNSTETAKKQNSEPPPTPAHSPVPTTTNRPLTYPAHPSATHHH